MKTTDILMEIKEAMGRIEEKLDNNCKDTKEVKIQATKTNGRVTNLEKRLSSVEKEKNEIINHSTHLINHEKRLNCIESSTKTIKWVIGSGIGTLVILKLIEIL